jgi:hypothetical protein
MFEQRTVFVIGAGASSEFSFPLGTELAARIKAITRLSRGPNLDGPIVPLMQQATQLGDLAPTAVRKAANDIHEGISFSNSIDDFLDQRQADPAILRLGKMAVAKLILEAEKSSHLYRVSQGEVSISGTLFQNTWLYKLAKMLFKRRTPGTVDQVFDNVSFITFNYDRSLELYLTHAISKGFAVSLGKAQEIVSNAPIIHIYGSVGNLFGSQIVHYGNDEVHHNNFLNIAERIHTYTESYNDDDDRRFIEQVVGSAEKLVFLGCGFHQQNIDVLRPSAGIYHGVNIIGTTLGVSTTDDLAVLRRICRLYASDESRRIGTGSFERGFHKMKCYQFLDEYSLSLTE